MSNRAAARLGAGALMIAIPAAAAAIAAAQALASPAQAPAPDQAAVGSVAYGHDVVVRGSASRSDAGHTVVLEFAPRGATAWSQLGSTTIGGAAAFRWPARLEQLGPRAGARHLERVSDAVRGPARSGGAAAPTSRRARRRRCPGSCPPPPIKVLAGQAVLVRGRLLPAVAGRKVSLEASRAARWHTLTTARTGSAGRFALRYVAGSAGQQPIRVRFAGDR